MSQGIIPASDNAAKRLRRTAAPAGVLAGCRESLDQDPLRRWSESHRTEDVLMLFRCTENPPENAIFTPAEPPVSAVAFAYTENSSFPYARQPCCD